MGLLKIDSKSVGLYIVYFRALNYDVFLSLKVVLILANSADPFEMQHFICIFTVCKSDFLRVSNIQRVKLHLSWCQHKV